MCFFCSNPRSRPFAPLKRQSLSTSTGIKVIAFSFDFPVNLFTETPCFCQNHIPPLSVGRTPPAFPALIVAYSCIVLSLKDWKRYALYKTKVLFRLKSGQKNELPLNLIFPYYPEENVNADESGEKKKKPVNRFLSHRGCSYIPVLVHLQGICRFPQAGAHGKTPPVAEVRAGRR